MKAQTEKQWWNFEPVKTDTKKMAIAQQQASDAAFDYQQLKTLYDASNRKLNVAVKGINDFLDGDYPHPKSYRPKQCPHDKYYYQDCSECDTEHFENVLESMA